MIAEMVKRVAHSNFFFFFFIFVNIFDYIGLFLPEKMEKVPCFSPLKV
jgi:hypothetical protein